MSWTTLSPPAFTRNSRARQITAVLRKLAGGIYRVQLYIPATVMETFGFPKNADLFIGSGEDTGRVKIVFGEGAFKLTPIGRNGGTARAAGQVSFDAPADFPKAPGPAGRCEEVQRSDKAVIIALPMQQWSATALTAPRASGAPLNAPTIDAVTYLTAKGQRISSEGVGKWLLNGELVTKGVIVRRVNEHRSAEGRDPLTPERIV